VTTVDVALEVGRAGSYVTHLVILETKLVLTAARLILLATPRY